MSSPPGTRSPLSLPLAAAEPDRRRTWRVAAGCGVGGGLVLAAVALAFVLHIPVDTTCARWDQPAGVKYGSFEPYVVYVKDRSSWWNVFARRRYCRVGVMSHHQEEPLLYGHWVEYEFNTDRGEAAYFARCRVEWTPDGVRITEPTGHELFVPKKAFIGGR